MKFPASLAIDILASVFFFLSLIIGSYQGAHILLPAVLFSYHLWKIWHMRGSAELAFLLIFSITYPLFWILSLALSVDIHYLFPNVDNMLVAKALSAQGLFLGSLFIGMRNSMPVTIANHARNNSALVFWACIAGMVVSLFIVVSTVEGSIFEQSYDYELSGSSILFEYILILIIIAYTYSGQNILRKHTLVFLSVLFVLTPIYFGKRLPASMVAFALLLLFWRPKSLKQVLFIFSLGFFTLSALALFRVGDSSGQSVTQILLNIGDQGAMRNNQGGVIYSSAAYMKLVQDGIFDIGFAFDSILNTGLSIFLPSSMVNESAYINFAAMRHIPIPGNGGLPGVAFYVWGRAAGVIVAGLFFGWIMYRSRNNYLAAVYASFLLFTFPRWMAYNINIMFKAGCLLILGYLFIRFLSYASKSHTPKIATRTTN